MTLDLQKMMREQRARLTYPVQVGARSVTVPYADAREMIETFMRMAPNSSQDEIEWGSRVMGGREIIADLIAEGKATYEVVRLSRHERHRDGPGNVHRYRLLGG